MANGCPPQFAAGVMLALVLGKPLGVVSARRQDRKNSAAA
jgi:Na+/H+ antiporter NhaA